MTAIYKLSLLQAKSYRFFKAYTTHVLKKHKISLLDFSLLGIIYDNHEVRLSEIASELGVEPPFVTVLVEELTKKNYIASVIDREDKRVKKVTLTKKGKAFLEHTEADIKSEMKVLLKGLSVEMYIYIKVMQTLIENAEKINQK
jgi:DNA-binding MarR family transcriptional regulator